MSSVRGPQRCSSRAVAPEGALDRVRARQQSLRARAWCRPRCTGSRTAAGPRRPRAGSNSRTSARAGACRHRRTASRCARVSVSRTSPTLPPSASSASVMTGARDGDADVREGRGDRGVRLVDRHPHRRHLGKAREDRVGDRAGGRFDQPIAPGAERLARDLDDLVVADRVGELVGTRRRPARSMSRTRSSLKVCPTLASCCITP